MSGATLPNEAYDFKQAAATRDYRVCRGCDRMRPWNHGNDWHHQRYKEVDYFACSKKCWEDTLRKYPEMLAQLKVQASDIINRAEQEALRGSRQLAELERIEGKSDA